MSVSIPTTHRTAIHNAFFSISILLVFWIVSHSASVAAESSQARSWTSVVTQLPEEIEYVIITPEAFASEFQRLADFRSQEGLPSTVITVEWILDNGSPGVDLPETIRNFLQAVHEEWGLRFLLLGGDSAFIPPRYVHNTYYPPQGYTDIPTDFYYACLDGNWDADGDGIYGEAYVSEFNPGDDADLNPELAVGRAPVNDLTQAAIFVDKILTFESRPPPEERAGTLLAEMLFPPDWNPGDTVILDGASWCEEYALIWESFVPPISATRLYENYQDYPPAEPLTKDAALAAMASGENLIIHHSGHGNLDGMSVGNGVIGPADVAALTNAPSFFFLVALFPYSAAFDYDCLLERILLNPDGGSVGGLGSSRETFPYTIHEYQVAFYEEIMSGDEISVGEAVKNVVSVYEPYTFYNTVHRWTCLTLTLLGDPALVIPFIVETGVNREEPVLDDKLLVYQNSPNPFNPLTTVRFSLPETQVVRVDVYAVDGKYITTLINKELIAGPHFVTWNGKDMQGRAVASGTYFYRLEAGTDIETRRMMLVR